MVAWREPRIVRADTTGSAIASLGGPIELLSGIPYSHPFTITSMRIQAHFHKVTFLLQYSPGLAAYLYALAGACGSALRGVVTAGATTNLMFRFVIPYSHAVAITALGVKANLDKISTLFDDYAGLVDTTDGYAFSGLEGPCSWLLRNSWPQALRESASERLQRHQKEMRKRVLPML